MGRFYRVRDDIDVPLSADFLAASVPSGLGPILGEDHLEVVRENADLSGLDTLIENVMESHDRYDTAMDRAMTVDLHRALGITRREAGDKRMWAWLGTVHAPDFVAWRWKPGGQTGQRNRDRFCGGRIRQTFARLWWAAELTREGDDYALTRRLLQLPGFQDIYEAVFGREFGNYRPALAAFVHELGNENESVIRQCAVELGYALTTVVLETLSYEQTSTLIRDLRDRVTSRAGETVPAC